MFGSVGCKYILHFISETFRVFHSFDCRLCGVRKFMVRYPIDKNKFAMDIKRALNVDVKTDDDSLPKYICDSCARKLQKWHKRIQSHKKASINIVLRDFSGSQEAEVKENIPELSTTLKVESVKENIPELATMKVESVKENIPELSTTLKVESVKENIPELATTLRIDFEK